MCGRRVAVVACGLAVMLTAAAALVACGGSAGSGGATIKVTAADNAKTVTAKVGDEVSVTLKENPTTGYEWNMVAGPGLTAASDHFIAPSPAATPMMGAGGVHTWVYKVDQAGALTLAGTYARSWEPDSKSAAHFSLTVDATK
jgi:inhibitor of cysteine peptidase